MYEFKNPVSRDQTINIRLEGNADTEIAVDDFGKDLVCAVIWRNKERSLLCSYSENWNIIRKNYQFVQASAKFFFTYELRGAIERKQIFRLEWENWHLNDRPNKAAYPHWQFDRWLTGSDAQTIDDLKASFQEPAEKVFETAEAQVLSVRPYLGWFTRVHFPVSASWATCRVKSLDDAIQPHRTIPNSVEELENWLDSALFYVANEVRVYAG